MALRIILRCCAVYNRELMLNVMKIRKFHIESSSERSTISFGQIKKFLRQKNVNMQDGYACITLKCPICNESANDSKVFVNKATGFFMCTNCRHIGPWDYLERFLEPKKTQKSELEKLKQTLPVEDDFSNEWNGVKRKCTSISRLSEEQFNEIIHNYALPSVTQDQLKQLDCHYEVSSSTLYFPIVAIDKRIAGFKSLKADPVLTETTVPNLKANGLIVYKEKRTKSESTAVLVPTVEDLLALISQKAANNVICLPYELKHMPLQILPILESYKKLILWFANDAASWDSARHFSKKLNEKRCYFVRPTNHQPRPKAAAVRGYDLKNIINEAQPIWHKSITNFSSLREDVLSDLQNIDKVQGVKWMRYPSLNRILKGHRRGEFTILTGPTGCGKTTFMSEYSLDLAMQGVNTLWGSFEIRNARLARTMLQQMSGVPLDENLQDFDSYADAFEKLPIYFMTFHGQQSLDVVMDAVEHATYVHDIAHVIIDNVQFMIGMADQSKHLDRYWRQDMIVAAFRAFATKNDCHVTLVIHPRKERVEEDLTTASIFGGAKASQEADNILIIQDKRLTNIRGKKYLQIAKNRYSGDLGIMNLEFDKASLSYQQRKKQKSQDTQEKELKTVSLN